MAIYFLRIDLKETQPLVTRNVMVSSESSMYLLHHIIQAAMGWLNNHLYEFTKEEVRIGDTRLLDDEMGPVIEAKKIKLKDVLKRVGESVDYEYDFGDVWKHEITLVSVSQAPQLVVLPYLISGKNACPPEDCGGISGFEDLKKIISNPKDKEFGRMRDWIGLNYDPLKFNKKTAESKLAKLNASINSYEKGFE